MIKGHYGKKPIIPLDNPTLCGIVVTTGSRNIFKRYSEKCIEMCC